MNIVGSILNLGDVKWKSAILLPFEQLHCSRSKYPIICSLATLESFTITYYKTLKKCISSTTAMIHSSLFGV